MTCKLPEKYRRTMEGIAECQKYNPSDTVGMGEPCVDVMMKAMARVGARYLGRGNFRHAWAFKQGNEKCVVKLANNEVKRDHNKIEDETWKTAPPKLKRYLTPVTDADPKGLWLVMPEAERKMPSGQRWQMGQAVTDIFEDAGYLIDDQHEGNVGLLKGKLVSIDYGFGIRRYTGGRGHVYQTAAQSKHLGDFEREMARRKPRYTYIGGGGMPFDEYDEALEEDILEDETRGIMGWDDLMKKIKKREAEKRRQGGGKQEKLWEKEGGWKWRKTR